MENVGKKGVVYVAFGYEYLVMAFHSARTARESNPGICCELITNIRFDNNKLEFPYRFDRVSMVESDTGKNRFIKTNVIKYTELEFAVYLDCDTEVKGSLDPVFSCLERFDLAIKLCPKPTEKVYDISPGIDSSEFPEWNGGVIFFRNNERSGKFFETWSRIFQNEGKNRDQPALAKTIYECGSVVHLLSLNSLWNTFPNDLEYLKSRGYDSRIWHYRRPERRPAVALGILEAHKVISPLVKIGGTIKIQELDEVGTRYAFLSSRIYTMLCSFHPDIGEVLGYIVRGLMQAGIIRRFRMRRNSVIDGDDYQCLHNGKYNRSKME